MKRASILNAYLRAHQNIPPPGCGCHSSLLGIANLGALAGLSAEKIFSDIRKAIPLGARRVPDHEIREAVNKAVADHGGKSCRVYTPRPVPVVRDGKTALRKIISQAKIHTEADLLEQSPIRLGEEPQMGAILLLETLYKDNDKICIGDRYSKGIIGDTIRDRDEWISHFHNEGTTAPFIIINPLTGIPTAKKVGDGFTLRGDGNVAAYRHALVEFDTISREDQICFWSAAKLPVVALIDSGGKSIHGWLDVQKLTSIETPEEWAIQIKGRLYNQMLAPLGIDTACCNPARLSRLPGHFRSEKGAWQRLLWLSPEGRPVSC